MLSLVLAAVAGLLLQAAFPPFYQGWLAVPALVVLFYATKTAKNSVLAFGSGLVFGLIYVGGLMIWLRAVPGPAWVALTSITAIGFGFSTLLGFKTARLSPSGQFAGLAGSWLGWLLILRYAPIFSTEWPDPGYTVVQWELARDTASLIGTTGWSAILALSAAAVSVGSWSRSRKWIVAGVCLLILPFITGFFVDAAPTGETITVAIVQGNSPCEGGVHCSNEREIITQNHLELTAELDRPIDLVVWAESSTGYLTDPAQNLSIASEISNQAVRLDSHFLIGSDRPVGDSHFTNSNILINPQGNYVDEYSKQHGVPFGEYVPYRRFFERWPSIVQISRDMIPGTGPVLLDIGAGQIGSVISYEAAFGRYSRMHAKQGAQLLVVATNEASYGTGAAADQLIAMSVMRGAENGLDVVHSAITGSSVIISNERFLTPVTQLFEQATIQATVTLREEGAATPYARYGDWLVSLTLLVLGSVLITETVATRTEQFVGS